MLVLLASAVLGVGSASAAVSPDRLGVNAYLGPTDLSMASANGLGLARAEVTKGQNSDPLVAALAAAHLRLYPMMGLPTQLAPADAATAMAQYVTSFAQRYGPGGTFWSSNPKLPYMPVQSYEIGNEPNLPSYWVQDGAHLHWSDPSSYAEVYEAARTALHQVDPTGVAVVGGLADTARDGVDLPSDEQWLAALAPGSVDAVALHPYTFFVDSSLMWSDTEQLRQWMDANGMAGAPIDIDEVGACDVTPQDTLNTGCGTSISSADWGTFAAGFTEWALCSTALNVRSMQPEYWGDLSTTDTNAILALVDGEGSPTPYGQDYLGEAKALGTQGCPIANTSPPTISGSPVSGQSLTASAGGWTGNPAPAVAYQWERCNGTGSCTNIPGARSATYQAQPADVGSSLVALVTASNPGGSETAWSQPSGAVGAAPSTGETGGGGGNGGGSGSGSGPHPTTGSGATGSGATGSRATGSGATGSGATGSTGGSTPSVPALPRMRLRISGVHVHRGILTITVSDMPGSKSVKVLATQGHHQLRLRLVRHNHKYTTLTFTAKLHRGRWIVNVTCAAPRGYAAPGPVRRTVKI